MTERRRALCGALLAALTLCAEAPLAQEQDKEQPAEAQEQPKWIAADLPPSAYVEGPPPPPVEKIYSQRPARVWKKLLGLLESEGLETAVADEESGLIQTELESFDELMAPFTDVALPPPPLTAERPIRQWARLNRGRYRLDVLVSPDERTRVSIRATIEERAYHVAEDAKLWVQRHSNGTIEKYFIGRLDKALE